MMTTTMTTATTITTWAATTTMMPMTSSRPELHQWCLFLKTFLHPQHRHKPWFFPTVLDFLFAGSLLFLLHGGPTCPFGNSSIESNSLLNQANGIQARVNLGTIWNVFGLFSKRLILFLISNFQISIDQGWGHDCRSGRLKSEIWKKGKIRMVRPAGVRLPHDMCVQWTPAMHTTQMVRKPWHRWASFFETVKRSLRTILALFKEQTFSVLSVSPLSLLSPLSPLSSPT